MSWIVCILLILLAISLMASLKFFRECGLPLSWLIVAFLVKVVVAIAFIRIYTDYYPDRNEADLFKYFDDGKELFEVSKSSGGDFIKLMIGIDNDNALATQYMPNRRFWDSSPTLPYLNDNRLMIRINALLMFISSGNILVHSIVAIFISFTGLLFLFLALNTLNLVGRPLLYFIVFFNPSLLFWTSGMLKESLVIFGFGTIIYLLFSEKRSWKMILLCMLSLFIMLQTKLYVLLSLIPPIIAFIWEKNKNDGKIWLRYLSVNLIFLALVLNSGQFFPGNGILQTLAFKQSEFKCLAEWMNAGSIVFVPDLGNEALSFLLAVPYALLNVLLRPLPWDSMNTMAFAAMIEIMAIALLWPVAIFKWRSPSKIHLNFILFCSNFILIMSLLIGWTSPVMGAIVRYRIFILPFMILIPLVLGGMRELPFLSQKRST